MATPITQQQSMQLTCNRGASARYLSKPVLKLDGTPVDFTVGTWLFGLKVAGSNANPTATPVTVTNRTISGDASGVLTIDVASGAQYEVPSNTGQMWILMSNDAFSTSNTPIQGNFAVSPSSALG